MQLSTECQGTRHTLRHTEETIILILTGSLFSAIPPILAFIFFQRHLVSGIVAGIGK